jgi:putative DNA methylase
MHTFSRQAIPMTWDFVESNIFGDTSICWTNSIKYMAENLLATATKSEISYGLAEQKDASIQDTSLNKVISTDPPYYDNVPYADLSDYFYVWLRRSLRPILPALFATVAVPKIEELVAFAHRHENSKSNAETFFLDGMSRAMKRLFDLSHPAFPVTIYYAFKQTETNTNIGTSSTGWETFLEAVIRSGFAITGTWPIRTELLNRMRGIDSNALASSIVLVCRKRWGDIPSSSRREFIATLKNELPLALKKLQEENIAPVDLSQAAIGPGMEIYTRFKEVLNAEGNPLSVHDALLIINQVLDETLADQEGNFDPETRWALTWFDQNGFQPGEYGTAQLLSLTRNTSVEGLVSHEIITSKAGKVRLLQPFELNSKWDPLTIKKITAWEIVHHLIRMLETNGEKSVAEIINKIETHTETVRELCYRLYGLCERKKRATEAMSYNGLIQSWPEIVRLARETSSASKSGTQDLFDQE